MTLLGSPKPAVPVEMPRLCCLHAEDTCNNAEAETPDRGDGKKSNKPRKPIPLGGDEGKATAVEGGTRGRQGAHKAGTRSRMRSTTEEIEMEERGETSYNEGIGSETGDCRWRREASRTMMMLWSTSTSKGVMTDRDARSKKIGGELIRKMKKEFVCLLFN